MKNYFILLFSLLCICCFSQTKEELMNSIIKRNVFESDCIGAGCTMSEQYENFQKLIKISSEKELLKLTDHKNSVLRVYAQTYFIEQNKNVIEIFKKELKRNKKIETYEGCLIDFEYTYSIIYHNYWNSVRLNSITEFDTIEKIRNEKMSIAVQNDEKLKLLDSLILKSNQDLYWLLYSRSFDNQKNNNLDIKQLEKLAFKKNNFYAFSYLVKNDYENQEYNLEQYFKSKFIKANFDSENKIYYLFDFIEYLLNSNNNEYKKLVAKKLNKSEYWKKYSGSNFYTLLENHQIKL